MNIFLTGATGFIGQKFLLLALKEGHSIYALSKQKQKFKHKNLKWLNGPITKKWNHELKTTEIIVHLASEGVNNKNIPYDQAKKFNVTDSLSFFKNAVQKKCTKWIIAGSASEYGKSCRGNNKISIKTKPKPESTYEKTKYTFSKKILLLSKKTKSKCRIMRIFPVYGDGENKKRLFPSILKAAINDRDFYVNNGDQVRDFTNVKFVAKAILDACDFNKKKFTSHQIWHISSGNPMSVKNFTKKIWRKYKAKGNLIFKKVDNKKYHNYVSDKKSIWKI